MLVEDLPRRNHRLCLPVVAAQWHEMDYRQPPSDVSEVIGEHWPRRPSLPTHCPRGPTYEEGRQLEAAFSRYRAIGHAPSLVFEITVSVTRACGSCTERNETPAS